MRVCGKDGHSLTGGQSLRAGRAFAVSPSSVSARKWSLFIIAIFLFEQSGIDAAAVKHATAGNPRILRCRMQRAGV